jgi:hypothetical protein
MNSFFTYCVVNIFLFCYLFMLGVKLVNKNMSGVIISKHSCPYGYLMEVIFFKCCIGIWNVAT